MGSLKYFIIAVLLLVCSQQAQAATVIGQAKFTSYSTNRQTEINSITTALAGKEPANANIQAHIGSTLNPHSTTAAQVGAEANLGNPSVSGYVLSSTTGGARSWIAPAGGGSPVAVFDESSTLTSGVTSLDFVGAGVTATTTGNAVTITIPGGAGGSTWGSITGTLSNQTDLQTALNGKQASGSYAPATSGTSVLLGNGSGGFSAYAGGTCAGNTHVTAISATGTVTCDTTGGIETVQDEGVDLNQRQKVNFTGTGISCADNAGQQRTDCTVVSTKDTTAVTGILKGNGTAVSAAISGTDYQAPIGTISGIVKGNGANALTAATVRTDYAEPTTGLGTGILKNTTGTGAHTIAVAGTDYQAPINGTGFVKATGTTISYDNSTYSTTGHTHSGTYEPANANIQSHISSTSNPHSTTASQVGAEASLGNPASNGYVLSSTTTGTRSWIAAGSGLPDQTGNNGKFLTTNGSAASWATLAGGGDMVSTNNLSDVANVTTARNNILPSKTGNSLKVLRVNSGETDYELATPSSGGGDGSIGLIYTFENTAGGNPSSGALRLDNATPSSATLIHISETTKGGITADALLDLLYIDSIVKIADKANPETAYHFFQVNKTFTSGAGSPVYDPVPVSYLFGTGTLPASGDVVLSIMPAARRVVARSPMKWEQDFLHASFSSPYTWHIPWTLAAIASGTASMRTGDAAHPGIIGFLSSTTTNSGGYAATTTLTSLLIAGGEESELVFRIPTTTTNTVRFGFLDSVSSTQPTDGCWMEFATTTASGYCKNNAGPTQTGSTYTITANTWYRGKITVNASATSVLFELFNSSGTLLWSNTVAANIPTAAGRETGHGVVATNSGTAAVSVLDIDYLSLIINRNIAR